MNSNQCPMCAIYKDIAEAREALLEVAREVINRQELAMNAMAQVIEANKVVRDAQQVMLDGVFKNKDIINGE